MIHTLWKKHGGFFWATRIFAKHILQIGVERISYQLPRLWCLGASPNGQGNSVLQIWIFWKDTDIASMGFWKHTNLAPTHRSQKNWLMRILLKFYADQNSTKFQWEELISQKLPQLSERACWFPSQAARQLSCTEIWRFANGKILTYLTVAD